MDTQRIFISNRHGMVLKGVTVDFAKNMPSFTDVELCNS